MYCVYDSKVEAYMMPFYVQSKGQAIRMFAELANDKDTNVGKYPAEFTLFDLGEIDDSNAKFKLHSTPIAVGVAIEFIKSE